MAGKNYGEMARQIVEHFGGKENISWLNHCATRLRINPTDKSKVDLKALEKVPGVLGVADNGEEVQVIIGQSVEQLYPEVEALVGKTTQAPAEQKKKSLGEAASSFLLMMAGIMSPIIPALTTAGFLCVLLTLLKLLGVIQTTDSTYIILNSFAQAAFYFLPIYVAYTSARKFETEPVLAMLLAAALLYPDWVTLVTTLTGEGQTFTSYFGIPVYLMTYNGGVIQIVLSVWVMSKVDHWLSRVIPEVVRYFLKPFLLILIMSVVTLAVTGPLGGFVTNGLAAGISWLNSNIPWLAVPAIILFSVTIGQLVAGFHLALVPLATQAIQTVGYDTVVTIWFYCFTLSAGFVSLAVALKAKNSKCRQIAWPAALSGLIGGISEPTVYGIAYKMVKPYYALAITSVISGLVAGILGLKSYGYGSNSIPGMLLFLGPNGDVANLRNAIIVLAVMAVLSFVLVYAFGFDDSIYGEDDDDAEKAAEVPSRPAENLEVTLPGKGTYIAQKDIADPTFANGTVGPCFGMKPANNSIKAPVTGTVTMIASTNHAVGITTADGAQVMVHIGIDSVKLGGKGIKVFVSTGQRVKAGDEIAKYDKMLFDKEGIDDTIVTVLLDADDFTKIESSAEKPIVATV
jgi:PTS system beta-glucosides-specific IIC component